MGIVTFLLGVAGAGVIVSVAGCIKDSKKNRKGDRK